MMQKSGAIEGDTIVSRSTTPPNMENPLAKKRRMNWDNGLCGDVRNGGIVGVAGGGGGNNEAGAQQPSQELAKDHLQIDRRKGELDWKTIQCFINPFALRSISFMWVDFCQPR